jgi:hypothetical protein
VASKILGPVATGPNDAIRKSELDSAIAAVPIGQPGATGPAGIVRSTTAPTNTSILWVDTSEPGTALIRVVSLTQAQYNAIVTPDPFTLYLIV